jgi:hypothetical protein
MTGHYRKKPVVIEARQLVSDDDLTETNAWIAQSGGQSAISYDDENDVTVLVIYTLEGAMMARWDVGDWIIKGVQGEFYPCKPDIFAATYEPVSPAGGSGG